MLGVEIVCLSDAHDGTVSGDVKHVNATRKISPQRVKIGKVQTSFQALPDPRAPEVKQAFIERTLASVQR